MLKAKKNYIWVLLLLIFNFLGLGKNVSAITILEINQGSISHKDVIIITGNEFGLKCPAAPLFWDDFEGGSTGSSLHVVDSSNWDAYTGDGAVYSDTTAYSGSLSAYNYVEYGDSHPEGFETSSHYFSPTDIVYWSYMFKHTGTQYSTGVEKNGRLTTSEGSAYSGPGMLALSDSYVFYYSGDTSVYPDPPDEDNYRHFTYTPDYGASSWVRYQMYGEYSDPAGTANGLFRVIVGDETHENSTKTFSNIVNRPTGYSYQFQRALLGLMHDQGNLDPGEYHHMYIDDVYIDNTQARVEIGNASTWTACTQKVPQLPTAWSDTSISITVNQATFTNGSTVYIYVVDEDGVVNETGYPVTIGGTSTPQCSDTIDNDSDGLIDHPNDPGCTSAEDNDETDPITIRADVDQQNGITSTDAMLTLRNSLGLGMTETAWQDSTTTGDVNCDNVSNSTDAMLILRYSLGLDMSGTGWCI